jgi:lipoprotein signal peptidase
MGTEMGGRGRRGVSVRRWIVIAMLIIFSVLSSFAARHFGYGSCNYGVSFGLFSGIPETVWYAVTGVILVILGVLLVYGNMPEIMRWGVYILFAGGISNLIIRSTYGCVWDWIGLPGSGLSFNTADILIDVGIGLVLLNTLGCVLRKPVSRIF